MNGLRQPIDSPGGLPSARRQRPGLTWIAGLLAGLAMLHATESGAETAAESAADTSEAVTFCPSTWTVCASSSTPNPCYEGAPADAVGKYRYCTHGLDWECDFYMTGACWYSSTPCAEADTTVPAEDPEPGPCLDFPFTEVIECGYFDGCAELDSTEPYRYCTTYEDAEGEVFRLHCTCSSTPCSEAGQEPATAVQTPDDSTSAQHRLGPSNPLVIPLDLAEGNRVHLALYNAQRVRQLWDGPLPAGSHRFVWDGRRKSKALAAGVYLYKLEVGGQTVASKTIRIP